jgi:hypothetical protein
LWSASGTSILWSTNDKFEQQQHQADQQEHADEIADVVHTHHTNQPERQQHECNCEEHTASHR